MLSRLSEGEALFISEEEIIIFQSYGRAGAGQELGFCWPCYRFECLNSTCLQEPPSPGRSLPRSPLWWKSGLRDGSPASRPPI